MTPQNVRPSQKNAVLSVFFGLLWVLAYYLVPTVWVAVVLASVGGAGLGWFGMSYLIERRR